MRNDARPTPPRETVTVQGAADLLQVHEDTIIRLIRARKLIAFKVGHQWRIHRRDLVEYRRANQN